MDYIQVSAKTVELAVLEAAMKLGTTREHLQYKVIEKGSTGFLGIGSKKAVIEARAFTEEEIEAEIRAAAKAAEPKKEFKEKKEFKKDDKEVKEIKKESNKEGKKEFKKESGKEAAKDSKKEFKKEPKKEFKEKKEFKKEDKKEFKKESKKDFKERKEVKKEQVKETAVKEAVKTEVKEAVAEAVKEPVKKEAPAEKAVKNIDPAKAAVVEQFLKEVFQAMDMEVSIKAAVNNEDHCMDVELAGDDMGVLIGKRGQTLDSLQYLVSLVVNKNSNDYIRVKIDTENYRERRKETLENLAKNIAYKVKRTRKTVSLEPMNPYERRVIHSALQNDRYVTTHSEGEEPYRRVVVTLKDYHRKNKGER